MAGAENNELRANITARMMMWLVDDEYMAKTDVNDLLRDALHAIDGLKELTDTLTVRYINERSLADILAFVSTGLIAVLSQEQIDELGEFGEKIDAVLSAWQHARDIPQDSD